MAEMVMWRVLPDLHLTMLAAPTSGLPEDPWGLSCPVRSHYHAGETLERGAVTPRPGGRGEEEPCSAPFLRLHESEGHVREAVLATLTRHLQATTYRAATRFCQ